MESNSSKAKAKMEVSKVYKHLLDEQDCLFEKMPRHLFYGFANRERVAKEVLCPLTNSKIKENDILVSISDGGYNLYEGNLGDWEGQITINLPDKFTSDSVIINFYKQLFLTAKIDISNYPYKFPGITIIPNEENFRDMAENEDSVLGVALAECKKVLDKLPFINKDTHKVDHEQINYEVVAVETELDTEWIEDEKYPHIDGNTKFIKFHYYWWRENGAF